MTINLADNNPRIAYSVAEGATQTVFSVPFEFFEDADVNVYVDGLLKAEGTDYTLTGGEGSTGTLTFVTADPGETQQVTGATGGSTVVLFRRVALERTTDFQTGQDINRSALNEQLDVLTAIAADMNDRLDRAVHISDYDTEPVNFVLPNTSVRAGNYFAFDVNGDPVMTAGTTSDIIASAFAETFLDDENGNEVLNTLGVTATASELNALDGVTWTLTNYNALTSTAAELNILDGDTSATATTLVNADRVVVNAAGTMVQVAMSDVSTYMFGSLSIDEDDMASDSDTAVPTQQSVKAYVDALPFSEEFESAEQTITLSGTLTLAHGLSGQPAFVQAWLVCKTADQGYSVNDRLLSQMANEGQDGGNSRGLGIYLEDTSNIGVIFGSDHQQIIHKTLGTKVGITSSSWRLVVRAWR